MARAFHATTHPSLQARVLAAARRARAATDDCGRRTPDANTGTRASNPGALQPMPLAHATGSLDSQDRLAVAPPASVAAVPAGMSMKRSRSASDFAAVDEMSCRSLRTVCFPWTDLFGGNHPASVQLYGATGKQPLPPQPTQHPNPARGADIHEETLTLHKGNDSADMTDLPRVHGCKLEQARCSACRVNSLSNARVSSDEC